MDFCRFLAAYYCCKGTALANQLFGKGICFPLPCFLYCARFIPHTLVVHVLMATVVEIWFYVLLFGRYSG